ncbi:MAG: pyridoxal phosphate-dependent aminotransferase [Gaiellales bacterium]
MSGFPHYSALSLRLSDEPDPAWKVHQLAMERAAAGEDVIILSIGEPDSPPPPAVLAEIEASIARGRTRYSAARGEDNVVAAICRYTSQQAGRDITPAMVNFFPGAQTALFGMLMTIAGPGDGLIVPEPFYAPYTQVLGATGVEVGHIALSPDRGFHPSIDELRTAITPRTRAMVITNPHNPTGAVLSRDELMAIAELCREHDMWLVADEVYGEFVYAGSFTSVLALEGYEDRVVSLGTLSKSYAMTGFRHGWAISPADLGARAGVLLEAMLFGCVQFIQDAGAVALSDGGAFPRAERAKYLRRLDRAMAELEGATTIAPRRPEAGMFVMIDIRPTGLEAEEFALRLLDEEKVAVLPTHTFGPSGAGHVRISLGMDDERLVEAARRIRRFADAHA